MQTTTSVNNKDVSNLYRNYVLGMLTLVYVFNFVDRQVLLILQESIKKELHLSDAQLGLLSGLTFAVFYVIFGIPIARLADKTNRRNTIAISLSLWSIMTGCCGLARNFTQLLLARVGVGVGEAGGSPPAHAMISDYFPPEKRSTALSIYSAGLYLGVLVGFLSGGYLNQHIGWRTAFVVVGLPGIVFSLFFYLTVKEPKRGATDTTAAANDKPSLGQVLKHLYATKTFVHLAIASSLNVFCIYGLINWAPSFLQRLHGLTSLQTGKLLGPVLGIGGGLGSFAGGWLTDRFGKADKRLYIKIPAYAVMLTIPCTVGAIFFRDTTLTVTCLGLCALLQSVYLGPSIAVSHSLVPASMRAMTSAVFFLVINLIGQGLGPTLVGLISTMLKSQAGVESLRWALSIVPVIALISSILFFSTAKKLVADLELRG